jgi:hypothetical protein
MVTVKPFSAGGSSAEPLDIDGRAKHMRRNFWILPSFVRSP